ncbi:MAG: hypothetical protein H6744_03310 [Deltaproteobacteria bacterium]|nr:hypothetical protein [Deltaproteobacteria bacterium]MCB9785704.1 hypothetical protein [Deltaproteobacteria bacterium]
MRQRAQSATVVVATADPLLRWALVERLGDAGYAVVEAISVADLRARLARKPLAVILDERLGDRQRMGLLEVVDERSPDSAVLLLAVEASQHAEALAARRGASVTLSKPFDFEVLLAELAKALPAP